MDSNKHEKRVERLVQFGRKNGFCRIIALALIFFEIAYFHLIIKLSKNIIRISSVAMLLFFCILFGSFESIEHRNDITDYSMYGDNKPTASYNAVYADSVETDGETAEAAADTADDYADNDETEVFSTDELLRENESFEYIKDSSTDYMQLNEFNPSDWNLILINRQHPLPEDYSFELGTITKGMSCDERIVSNLLGMFRDAYNDGVVLVVCSPYRPRSRQEVLFDKKIKNYMKKGYSYTESYRLTGQAVTVPGTSEHEAGLAIDIVTDDYVNLNEGFADTDAGKWLVEHSWEYGFILRYPLGKEDITGIEYEPWHFRYVGVDAAHYITENGLTLEEFTTLIEGNVNE